MRTARLLCLGALAFGAVGVAVVLPATLLPVLIERLALSFTSAGMFLAAQPLGHLVAVLAAPRALRNVSPRWLLSTACFALAMAVGALGWVVTWAGALAVMVLSGMGIGVLEVGTNTVLLRAARSPNRILNLAHLFFGVTSVATPALATLAMNAGAPWAGVWAVAGVLVATPGLAWLALLPSRYDLGVDSARSSARSLPRGVVVALALAMATYVGAEIGFGSWYTKYMITTYGVPLSAAGTGLALYWAGLTGGRLVLGLVAPAHGQVRILVVFSAAAAVTSAAALLAPDASVFVACTALLGATLAGIFPGILAVAGRWSPHALPAVTGILLAGAGSGQILFPWAMAAVAEHIGLVRAMWFYPMLCLSVGVALLVAEARRRRATREHT